MSAVANHANIGGFKIIDCAQGSPEWHQARAGVITASMFKVARSMVGGLTEQQTIYVNAILDGNREATARELAGYKAAPTSETVKRALAGEKVGDHSDAAKDYAFRLAWERITGVPMDEGFETWQMARGHELEPAARKTHEIEEGVFVETAGFVTTMDGVFGASADGLIGDDDGAEYKCLVSPARLRNVLLNNDISDFVDQVQGCMWITGRKRWKLGFYTPDLALIGYPLHVLKLDRDDDYIATMERELLQFKYLVDSYEVILRARGAERRAQLTA